MKIVAIMLTVLPSSIVHAGWIPPAENLGYPINTTFSESQGSISPDGTKFFFVRNNPTNRIFESTWNGSTWSDPSPLPPPVNEPGSESPHWRADTNDLYLASGDHGGQGGADLFVSHWSGSWGTPQNLGTSVNTSAHEGFPCLSSDGNRIYYSRDDVIWTAYKSGGSWIGAQLTGIGQGQPSSYHNGCLYFTSTRGGGYGGSDIWKAEGEGSSFDPAENLGPDVNTNANEGTPTWQSNGEWWMYFSSNKSGGSGSQDFYKIRWTGTVIESASLGTIKATFR
ncbi:hypothetical protein ACFL24_02525 [Patescibacteria group bacterium]